MSIQGKADAAKTDVRPNWKARHEAVKNLPELYPLPDDFPKGASIDVAAMRTHHCVFAKTDAECDERVDMLCRVQDPIQVLKIIAPHLLPPSFYRDPG
jgi:hypothetical protein